MISPKFLFVLIFFYNLGFVEANSRVSFSRPGDIIRIPSVNHSISRKLLSVNFSYELLSINNHQGNSNFSINSISKSGYQYGVSFVKPENPTNSSELGFHFQTNMLVYGNIVVDMGIHDIIWKPGTDSTSGLDTRDVSIFASLTSNLVYHNES